MKARKYIFGIALIGLIGSSCTDTWDEHYAQDTSKVNNTEISVVNATITDYLAQEPSLSDMYQLFNKTYGGATIGERTDVHYSSCRIRYCSRG